MLAENGRENFVQKQEKRKTLEDYQRSLRKRATPWEKSFKVIIKQACAIRETQFRFQHIFRKEVGGYIVDFWVPEYRLVFEIDGRHHLEGAQFKADQERDAWFAEKKIRVVRLLNSAVAGCAGLVDEVLQGRHRVRTKIRERKPLKKKCTKIIENGIEITLCPEITKGMVDKSGRVIISRKQWNRKHKKKKCRKETPGTFSGSVLWKG